MATPEWQPGAWSNFAWSRGRLNGLYTVKHDDSVRRRDGFGVDYGPDAGMALRFGCAEGVAQMGCDVSLPGCLYQLPTATG